MQSGWPRLRRAHAVFFALLFLHAALASGAVPAPVSTPVDINSADARTIAQTLKQVGPKKAAAIVDYRQQHGPFKTLDELLLVKGIGRGLLNQNRALIVVRPPEQTSVEIWWSREE